MFELSHYKDVDNAVATLVNQYYRYVDQGNMTAAYDFLEKNAETLKPYCLNAESLNKIERGIYDNARAINGAQKNIINTREPLTTDLNVGAEWLQEY